MNNAYAQVPTPVAAAAPQNPMAGVAQFIPMILIFAVFYFLLIRPQQKQQKRHRQMVADAKRGDEVITSSGILGKIVDVLPEAVKLQIADGVTIQLEKSHIQNIKGYNVKK